MCLWVNTNWNGWIHPKWMLKHTFSNVSCQFDSCEEWNDSFAADVCRHIFYGWTGQCGHRTGSQCDRASMLSAGLPEAEKLPYSTLHLQTNSSFAELNCRKLDRLGVRCFRLGRLGCRVILPGENNITACVKDTWRQLCSTSAVKVWNLGGWTQFYLFLCPWKQPYACISQSYFWVVD